MTAKPKRKSAKAAPKSKLTLGSKLSWSMWKQSPTAVTSAVVFVIIFAIVGGYLIYNSSHAASPELKAGYGGSYANNTAGGDCLDDNADGGTGSVVDIWPCNGSAAQHYSFASGLIHVGAGCARVQSASASNSGANGAVVIGGCQTGSSAPWGSLWTKQGGTFHNNHNGQCLTGSNGKAQVHVEACLDTSHNINQRWFPDTYGTTSSGGGGGGGGGGSTGYRNPFHGASVSNERIDEGVDFDGTATVYAIGNGTIVDNVCGSASGWEGGCWIEERLSDGKAAGKYVYVAEDCSTEVHTGEVVTTNTAICKMHSGGAGIEMGWAAHVGTLAMAHSEYYEGLATSFGQNYSQLLRSLGSPAGDISRSSAISHKALPAGWPTW